MRGVYTEKMKIAIFGLARSGLSAFRYLKEKTQHEVFLVNRGAPCDWECWEQIKDDIEEDHCLNQDDACDLFASVDQLILSPGIPREHPALTHALEQKVEIISEIEFAYRHSDIPVVGITGTNGKTTITTMIGEALALAGKAAFICGNIGRPYSDILLAKEKYDYAIVELSSFQLESIKDFHPHIAILTNITPNHAERYQTFASYREAKYHIFDNQTAEDFSLIGEGLDVDSIQAQVERIHPLDHFDYSHSHLIGPHNKMNFFCAYKVCEFLGVENLSELFQKFINQFTGVAFRLQYIRSFNGLKIYNDGKSTNDAATLAAVKSFEAMGSLYLALGGQPRSHTTTLNTTLKDLAITEIFAFGEASELICKAMENEFKVRSFKNLEEMFSYIKSAKLAGNFLFSPAFPSFDQYKNYELRGEHFTNLARNL